MKLENQKTSEEKMKLKQEIEAKQKLLENSKSTATEIVELKQKLEAETNEKKVLQKKLESQESLAKMTKDETKEVQNLKDKVAELELKLKMSNSIQKNGTEPTKDGEISFLHAIVADQRKKITQLEETLKSTESRENMEFDGSKKSEKETNSGLFSGKISELRQQTTQSTPITNS
uniref:Uncharacterized protein n=1 Tax=Panagrolaimus sp. JU765 TaxID=591449 RepID=A0AC34QD50_9BILA